MRSDRTDEIINNILSVRIEIAKLDLKIDQMFRVSEDYIQASGKQIPKKIIRRKEVSTDEEAKELIDLGFCGGDVIRCPNCNEYIVIDMTYTPFDRHAECMV